MQQPFFKSVGACGSVKGWVYVIEKSCMHMFSTRCTPACGAIQLFQSASPASRKKSTLLHRPYPYIYTTPQSLWRLGKWTCGVYSNSRRGERHRCALQKHKGNGASCLTKNWSLSVSEFLVDQSLKYRTVSMDPGCFGFTQLLPAPQKTDHIVNRLWMLPAQLLPPASTYGLPVFLWAQCFIFCSLLIGPCWNKTLYPKPTEAHKASLWTTTHEIITWW